MEFEAAVGSWADGYMSVSITLERARLSYTTYSETVTGSQTTSKAHSACWPGT